MKPQFCQTCAQPVTSPDNTRYTCENGHDFWNNPHSAVTIILMKGGKVLFARRGIEPKKDLYDFPGGFLEYGEHPVDAIKRELQEETGLIANDLELIDAGLQKYVPYTTVCDLVYVCRSWSGTMKANDDVSSLEWGPIDLIDSEDFAWKYPGLVTKLKQL